MESWQRLLSRAVRGLDALAAAGTAVPNWTLGGGTALMLQAAHRRSKDIDVFIPDPQYLAMLSPRLSGEGIWQTAEYAEAAHYLKLRYDEGEIDFIVSRPISALPPKQYSFAGAVVPLDDPVEIAIKKLYHRAEGLTPRDIFDIAVVAHDHEAELISNLSAVSHKRTMLQQRINDIRPDYYREIVDALDVFDSWIAVKADALAISKVIIGQIPR